MSTCSLTHHSRLARRLLACAVLVALLLTGVRASAQHAAGFDQRLSSLRDKTRGGRKVRVIATVAGAPAAAGMLKGRGDLTTRARTLGATGVKEIGDLPLVVMTVDEVSLERVSADAAITDIRKEQVYAPLLDTTVPLIGADNAHGAGVTGLRLSGQGVIAIIDTGVDRTHPDLDVIFEACISDNDGTWLQSTCPGGVELLGGTDAAKPCVEGAANFGDICAHGTHVAGIAAGTNGVAPDAKIVAINAVTRVTDGGGHTDCADSGARSPCLLFREGQMLSALQMVKTLSTNVYNFAALNMSFGGGAFSGSCDANDPAVTSLINDLNNSMAVVAGAGNLASTTNLVSPACINSVIAVGNTNDHDMVASGSSAGTALDLWAPGVDVWSTVPGGGIGKMDGTSMSSPHVAGAFALLRQLNPAITATQGLSVLAGNGVMVADARPGGMVTRPRINVLAAVREVAQGLVTPEANDQLGQSMAIGDFNSDGISDLALGVSQTVTGLADAGAVDVFYGSIDGPGIVQAWTQNALAMSETSEAGDLFGKSLAVGDFNGDTFDDLAIGVPGEAVGNFTDCGGVNVIYGSPTGLTKTGASFVSQESANVDGTCQDSDKFGNQLAVGNFNGDTRDDLAIGVPYENTSGVIDSGAVQVIYGSASGLSPTAVVADQVWTQASASIEEDPEQSDLFGWRLTTGDFNADGRSDLAIGVLKESVGAVAGAGAVNVIYGSATGLNATTTPDQLFSQDTSNIADSAETDDRFSTALASGDFNADGYADLAIGVLNESVGSPAVAQAGAVHVLYGGNVIGLSANNSELLTQSNVPSFETPEAADFFGSALAAGDVNSDGIADLAIGARGDNNGAGVVQVMHGSLLTGLLPVFTSAQIWNETNGIGDNTEQSDNFGATVGIGDFNGDGRRDLAIGVPLEKLGAGLVPDDVGAVNVLFQSTSNVLTAAGTQMLTE